MHLSRLLTLRTSWVLPPSPPPPSGGVATAIHPCTGPGVLPQSSMEHQHFINMLNGIANNIGARTDPLNLVRAFWGVQNAFGASWPFPSPSVDTSRDQTAWRAFNVQRLTRPSNILIQQLMTTFNRSDDFQRHTMGLTTFNRTSQLSTAYSNFQRRLMTFNGIFLLGCNICI